MANVTDYVHWRGDFGFDIAPWNEIDALAFATLAYLNLPGAENPEGVALKDVKGLVKPGKSDLDPSRILLLDAMAESRRFGDCRAHHFINIFMEEEEVQFSAVCFDIPDGSLCVAFRGTDSTLVGWKEDFNMCVLEPVPAQEAATFYLEKAAETEDRPIRVMGHSKGGNLSVFAAASAMKEVADRVTDVYTFDGPGMCPRVFESDGYARTESRIRSYVPKSAVVGLMMNHAREYTVVRSVNSGMSQHDSMSWEVYGPRFVTEERVDEKAVMIRQTLHEWLEQTDPAQREAFVDTAYRLIEETDATTVGELFGDKKKNFLTILNSARNLDPAMRNTFVKLSGMALSLGVDNFMERMPFRKRERKEGEEPEEKRETGAREAEPPATPEVPEMPPEPRAPVFEFPEAAAAPEKISSPGTPRAPVLEIPEEPKETPVAAEPFRLPKIVL